MDGTDRIFIFGNQTHSLRYQSQWCSPLSYTSCVQLGRVVVANQNEEYIVFKNKSSPNRYNVIVGGYVSHRPEDYN